MSVALLDNTAILLSWIGTLLLLNLLLKLLPKTWSHDSFFEVFLSWGCSSSLSCYLDMLDKLHKEMCRTVHLSLAAPL